jgi:sorbitol/mannitol transport system substrate-binding protein
MGAYHAGRTRWWRASHQDVAMRLCAVVLLLPLIATVAALQGCGSNSSPTTVTIATVNNGDMIVMKKLAPEFERVHPDIRLKWVVLEENVLRQRVTTDVATGAGQFDVVTIGNYEAPIWAKQKWLAPFLSLPADYDVGDLLAPVRNAVTYQGQLFAVPFYAESAMTYYRTDLFAQAGLKMPEHPTYTQIAEFAHRLTDRTHQVYGICLRGKPGWGENIASITSIVHAFGGRWFDMGWHAALDTPEWHRAITYYSELLKNDGPPGATSNGFNENLVLFASGHCAIWIDSTVAATLLYSGEHSSVAGTIGYAPMPLGQDSAAPTWLWSWNLAVPASSKHAEAAMKFATWATSKAYIGWVARAEGWIAMPPGTRQSTYDSVEYQRAAPFAGFVRNAIRTALPTDSGVAPRPYRSAEFVDIPAFQGLGTQVGQIMAATLTGQSDVDAALKEAQTVAERAIQQSGH